MALRGPDTRVGVAKGGLVCTLNTRCTVIAAMNPPAGSRLDVSGDLAASLGIASSLLSRFDMISRWIADVATPA